MSAYRLAVKQGETFTASVQWKISGIPVDLTGATARMELRASPGSTVLVTVTPYLTITAATGTVAVNVPAAITATWTFSRVSYDILLVLADATTKRLLEGDLYVSPQVTL